MNAGGSLKSPVFVLRALASIVVVHCTLLGEENDKETPDFGWRNEVIGALNVTQTSFHNWTQGGESTFSWQLYLTGKFVHDQEKYNWSHAGKTSFGKTKVVGTEARKSVDEIRLESVFTYKIGEYVNPYAAVTGETQLATGFDYTVDPRVKVSDFMDPGYFTQSVGVGYIPFAILRTRLGFGLKETITKDFPVPYADDPTTPKVEKTKIEFGLESVIDFRGKLSDNVLLTAKLELFSNLKRFDETDVKWDTIFTNKVSKYMAVNLNVKLFYDKNLSTKRQLKQGLALGVSYTFF